MPKLTFQPGLKYECDYMSLFWISVRDGISGPVCRTGLEISARAESLHVIANVFLRRFVQEAEVKSQPG